MEAITGWSHLAPVGKESKPAVLLTTLNPKGVVGGGQCRLGRSKARSHGYYRGLSCHPATCTCSHPNGALKTAVFEHLILMSR